MSGTWWAAKPASHFCCHWWPLTFAATGAQSHFCCHWCPLTLSLPLVPAHTLSATAALVLAHTFAATAARSHFNCHWCPLTLSLPLLPWCLFTLPLPLVPAHTFAATRSFSLPLVPVHFRHCCPGGYDLSEINERGDRSIAWAEFHDNNSIIGNTWFKHILRNYGLVRALQIILFIRLFAIIGLHIYLLERD